MPRMPMAMTRVMPSCLLNRRRNRFMGIPGVGLLPQGVPEDDVVHEAPLLPSLVRVYVDRKIDVELRAGRRGRREIGENVVVRQPIGDPDRCPSRLRTAKLPAVGGDEGGVVDNGRGHTARRRAVAGEQDLYGGGRP